MTRDEFRKLCRHWATGVSIVTSLDVDGKECGLTVNSVASLSLDPPLMLICLDNEAGTLHALKARGAFAINLLASDQRKLSERFALKNIDKFDAFKLTRGALDMPVLDGCLVTFECEVEAIYPGGDHQIIVGHVKHTALGKPTAKPLMFINGKYQ